VGHKSAVRLWRNELALANLIHQQCNNVSAFVYASALSPERCCGLFSLQATINTLAPVYWPRNWSWVGIFQAFKRALINSMLDSAKKHLRVAH